MRLLRFVLAFGLLSFGPGAQAQQGVVGPPNQIQCSSIATLAVGPTTITQIVAAVTGMRINVCGWEVTNTGAAGTFSLSYGTGANCGSGTTVIIPPLSVTSSQVADHAAFAYYSTPVSQALCITPSVATISAVIWYSQF